MTLADPLDLLQFQANLPVLILAVVLTVYSIIKLRKLMNVRLTFYFIGFFVFATAYYVCRVAGLLLDVLPLRMYGRLVSAFTCVALLALFALNLNQTKREYAIPAKIAIGGWWMLAEISGLYFGYQTVPGWQPVWNVGAILAASLTPLIALIISGSILQSGRKSTKLFYKVRAKLTGIPLALWIIAESLATVLIEGGQFYVLGLSPDFWVLLGILQVPFIAVPSLILFYVGFSMPSWLQVRLGIIPRTSP